MKVKIESHKSLSPNHFPDHLAQEVLQVAKQLSPRIKKMYSKTLIIYTTINLLKHSLPMIKITYLFSALMCRDILMVLLAMIITIDGTPIKRKSLNQKELSKLLKNKYIYIYLLLLWGVFTSYIPTYLPWNKYSVTLCIRS